MKKKILQTYENPVSNKHLSQCAELLNQGGVIAYPSDVNWAFGCLAHHKKAISKLYNLRKDSDHHRPLSIIFSEFSMLSHYADVNTKSFRILNKILPGAYTILLSSHKKLAKVLKQKRPEIGIRIPKRPFITQLVKLLDKPLASTSVILPNSSSDGQQLVRPKNVDEIAIHYYNQVDLFIDLSIELVYQETTVLRIEDDQIILIRKGLGELTNLV